MRALLVVPVLVSVAFTAGCPPGGNCISRGDVAPGDDVNRGNAVEAARAYLLSLDYPRRDKTSFAFDASEKHNWSNLPDGVTFGRSGLSLADMTDAQCEAAARLLFASTSQRGAQQFVDVIRADDVLAAQGAPNPFRWSSDNYYFSVFGEPSESGAWGWSVNGHHYAYNATFLGTRLAATPHFLGIDPTEYVNDDGDTVRPLDDERRVGFDVANGLGTALEDARIGHPAGGVLLGAGQDGKFPEKPSGTAMGELDDTTRILVREIIATWLRRIPDPERSEWLAEIDGTFDDVHFAWSGDVTDDTRDAYYRVHGPSVWIELSFEQPAPFSNSTAPHFHAVMRHPTNDYGATLVSLDGVE